MAQRDKITAFMKDVINEIPASSKGAGIALSDADRELLEEMIGRKKSLSMPNMSNKLSESGRTISDADRKRIDASVVEALGGGIKPKPRPDVGAIERGNRAARRTAQDLASMEEGGVAGGKVPKKYKGFSKLPEKVQEKISPDLAEKYEYGGEVKGKKGKKSKGNICRGGGAALRGTKFSGVR